MRRPFVRLMASMIVATRRAMLNNKKTSSENEVELDLEVDHVTAFALKLTLRQLYLPSVKRDGVNHLAPVPQAASMPSIPSRQC